MIRERFSGDLKEAIKAKGRAAGFDPAAGHCGDQGSRHRGADRGQHRRGRRMPRSSRSSRKMIRQRQESAQALRGGRTARPGRAGARRDRDHHGLPAEADERTRGRRRRSADGDRGDRRRFDPRHGPGDGAPEGAAHRQDGLRARRGGDQAGVPLGRGAANGGEDEEASVRPRPRTVAPSSEVTLESGAGRGLDPELGCDRARLADRRPRPAACRWCSAFRRLEDYEQHARSHGALVGRVANRTTDVALRA